MKDFLIDQMLVWTTDGSVFPDGISLYEYNKSLLLAFPTNVGVTSTAILAENPLIIMVNKPTASMNAKSF